MITEENGTDEFALHRSGTNPLFIEDTEIWNTEGRSFTEATVHGVHIFADDETNSVGIETSNQEFRISPESIHYQPKEGVPPGCEVEITKTNARIELKDENNALTRILAGTQQESSIEVSNNASHLKMGGAHNLEISDSNNHSLICDADVLSLSDSSHSFQVRSLVREGTEEGDVNEDDYEANWNNDMRFSVAHQDISHTGYMLSFDSNFPASRTSDTEFLPTVFLQQMGQKPGFVDTSDQSLSSVHLLKFKFHDTVTNKEVKIKFASPLPVIQMQIHYIQDFLTRQQNSQIGTEAGWGRSQFNSNSAMFDIIALPTGIEIRRLKVQEILEGADTTYNFIQSLSDGISGCMIIDFEIKTINFFFGC